jgi:hypothetical protein
MEEVDMTRKTAGNEFIKGLLERLGSRANTDTSSFHTSAFKHTFEGIRARFKELK